MLDSSKNLIQFLDEYFQNNVIHTTLPILLPKPLKSSFHQGFNQLFEIKNEDYILRYDLTNPFKQNPVNPNILYLSKGPVFRNGPTSGYRFKEFEQYDLDCCYNTQGYFILLKTIRLLNQLGLEYKIKINDLTILNVICKQNDLVITDLLKDLDSNNKHLKKEIRAQVIEKVSLKHQALLSENIIIEPQLVRGHDYYTELVFEIYIKNSNFATISGGCYFNVENRLMIGVSLGIKRLLKYITVIKNYLLIYTDSEILTLDLKLKIDELLAFKHHFFIKNKNFYKDYNKIKNFNETNYVKNVATWILKHNDLKEKFILKHPNFTIESKDLKEFLQKLNLEFRNLQKYQIILKDLKDS